MKIDAHQHFWDRTQPAPYDYSWQDPPENAPIKRSFLPADLKPLIDAAGIDRTVFVQAQHHLEETRWALGLADSNEWIAGVVGWLDLASPDIDDQLAEFVDHPKFVGVRHVVQDEPDNDFIIRPEILRGLTALQTHGVPYDLLFYVKHLRHADTLARKLPDLPMVIDHLSKPCIKSGRTDDWIADFKAAAAHDNIYCKLSGMITEADWQKWSPADLRPYVQTALELFGSDRLMFGSDWPVCVLAGPYQSVVDALTEALGPISADESAKIWGDTAAKFYGLEN